MIQEIENTILANFPVIYIVTAEENRLIKSLERFCVQNRRKLWIHSISEGLFNIAFSKSQELWFETTKGRVHEEFRDPIELLKHLKSIRHNEGVFVLLDFHVALKDALVQRLIKDVAHCFKQSKNSLVIVSPVLEIPPAIVHEICIQEFPLPTKEDLSASLESILEVLEKRKLQVELSKGDKERLVTAGQGLSMEQFEGCLARAVVTSGGRIDTKVIDSIVEGKKQIIKNTGLLEFFSTKETMDRIGGLGTLKSWLTRRQQAFTETARAYGLPIPKGILLLGVQGCGKSLTAKACASLWKFPLLRLDTGSLFSSQVGSSELSARRVIKLAEAISPCVLWIDEIEKAMAGVGSSSNSDAGTAARVFATIATWLQEKTAPVFVIATANSVTSLPPELIRKGRWDEIFFLDLPGVVERQSIIRIHLEKRNRNPNEFDIPTLADACPDYSGAEIEQAVIAGLYDAFDENRPLTTQDILANIKSQVPLTKTMAEHVQALRTWALTRARLASDDNIKEQKELWRSGRIREL